MNAMVVLVLLLAAPAWADVYLTRGEPELDKDAACVSAWQAYYLSPDMAACGIMRGRTSTL